MKGIVISKSTKPQNKFARIHVNNNIMWFFKKKADFDKTPLDKLNEIDDGGIRERLLNKSVKTSNEKENTGRRKTNKNI